MSEERSASERRPAGKSASWYPVPVRLVDEVMPRLRDSELRILMLVLRQTAGWKADRTETGSDRRRKCRDWLSHSQLCRRTGRGSDAVSRAVASLTASGLIVVEDVSGKPLLTSEERRRHLGRLYYRPGVVWDAEEA